MLWCQENRLKKLSSGEKNTCPHKLINNYALINWLVELSLQLLLCLSKLFHKLVATTYRRLPRSGCLQPARLSWVCTPSRVGLSYVMTYKRLPWCPSKSDRLRAYQEICRPLCVRSCFDLAQLSTVQKWKKSLEHFDPWSFFLLHFVHYAAFNQKFPVKLLGFVAHQENGFI